MIKRAAQGSGTIRKVQRNINGKTYEYWEGRITLGHDPGTGKQIQKSITGKTQAEVREKITEAIHKIDNGTFTPTNKTKIYEWLDQWQQVYCKNSVKPLTLSTYKGIIKNHIVPYIGQLELCSLTGFHVQKLYNQMIDAGLSPKTVKNVSAVLHKAINAAVKQGIIPFNPCNAAELPKQENKEIQPFTDREIPLFIDAIHEDELENAFLLCLFAGLREGECLGLSWRQVDFKKKTLTIDQQLQKSKEDGHYYIAKSTKSNRSRTIVIPDIAIDCLQNEKTRQMKNKLKSGQVWDNQWNLVFTDPVGQNIAFSTFYKRFKSIAASIGRPDARPHDLRHTAATVAIANGASVKSVQSLLGHSTASFTLNVYAHTSEEMMKDTASRMQNYYETMRF